MKRILLLSCAALICFQFSNAQEKDSTTKNAPHVSPQDQKFVDMEKALWDAWKTKDRKPYEDLLSAEFFEVDVTGTYDKATEISYMDKCDLKDYAILDPQVRHLNDQTVLLTYRLTVHDICEGQPVPEHLIINIVFVRENGKWLKVLDSEVPSSTTANGVSSQSSSNPSARGRLIGTWRLVSAEDVHPDGSSQPFPEYGSHPIGYLMYDSTGHMCVTLANPKPPDWTDPAKPTDAERVLTHKAMEAYCGTYEVREKEGRVIHRPELAEWPHYIGSDQVRNFRFEGNRLILSLEETIPNGGWRRSRITWERVTN